MSKHKYLTRDAILAADDLPTEDVHVPEWRLNGAEYVCVRTMTGLERAEYQASILQVSADGKDRRIVLENSDIRLCALTLVECPGGARLFNTNEVEVLGKKSAKALARVHAVAQRLNALTGADVEELANGLKEVPSDDSVSLSPAS